MCRNNCIQCVVPVSVTTSDAVVQVPYTERISKNAVTHLWVRTASGTQKDQNGKTLAASGVIKTAHLKLVDTGGTEKMSVPVEWLQRDNNFPNPMCIDGLDIDSSQCKIVLDTTASGYNAAHVIELLWAIKCPGPNCQ